MHFKIKELKVEQDEFYGIKKYMYISYQQDIVKQTHDSTPSNESNPLESNKVKKNI